MPMDSATRRRSVSVVGGGLSGFASAMDLIDKGYDVTLFCAEPDAGGKIQSDKIGNQVVNLGAEFVDSTQTGLRNLCGRLGVQLIKAEDQGNMYFRTPDGRMLDENRFFRAALPVKQKIARDKALIAADPQGRFARHFDNMTCEQYLASLGEETKSEAPKTIGARLKNLWAWATDPLRSRTNRRIGIDDVTHTLGMAYASEAGRNPREISSLQYLHESSADLNTLLESDCAFRVAGGTRQIIDKLQQYAQENGARLHFNSEVTEVNRQAPGGPIALTVAEAKDDGTKRSYAVASDQIVLALPSYAMGRIKGLETLGFSKDDIELLRANQYTKNAKFTVKVKGRAKDDLLIASDGFQAWKSSPDTLTFLVGGDLIDQMNPGKLVDFCLDKYAAAHGTTSAAMFDKAQIPFRGKTPKPCWGSPARGQVMQLNAFAAKAEELAKDGVGVVGTFLPHKGGVGFMECGVQSAKRNLGIMTEQYRDKAPAQQQALTYAQRLALEAPAPAGARGR